MTGPNEDVEMQDADNAEELPQQPQQQQQQEPKPRSIPPLRNLAPSIFVPLNVDITQPEEDTDRLGRLRRILESIDYHHGGMKENLMYMFEREKRRMTVEASERELALNQQGIKPGLPRPEEDMIVRNMEAPATPGKNYNLNEDQIGSYHIRPIPPGAPISIRDRTVVELLMVVERSLIDLESLDGFMGRIRERYLKHLERELETIAQVGLRPEERAEA
ncbi:hypothetical protein QBC42DRAFT_227917 [Cladorrhinum samala]|uniref:Uncharacterized protein n=1 Tax=Cladorrhinum samala TaxID=585594 RepID=A0AAV9HJZ4_9PEZI|nr:hypothetical protein QBC42DRAFT_227917 [Cladorrhinum samala]